MHDIFAKSPFGFAYFKIELDKHSLPFDYIALEVNSAFEKLTGIKAEQILEKKSQK